MKAPRDCLAKPDMFGVVGDPKWLSEEDVSRGEAHGAQLQHQLAVFVRDRLVELGRKASWLSRATGIGESRLSRLRNGAQPMTLLDAAVIADALGYRAELVLHEVKPSLTLAEFTASVRDALPALDLTPSQRQQYTKLLETLDRKSVSVEVEAELAALDNLLSQCRNTVGQWLRTRRGLI